MTSQTPQITLGGKEYLDKTISTLAPAFLGDPVFTWILHDHPMSEHSTKLPQLFSALFTQAALNGAMVVEIADFSCCSVLIPPGRDLENPFTMLSAGLIPTLWNVGFGAMKRTLFEYSSASEPLMKRSFIKQEQKEHWYIFIMGTAVNCRRQGRASRLLVDIQNRARNDGRPIWLEATTEVSRELYLKHGFEVVGEIVLGKGKVGSDGQSKNNGEGITTWSMIWKP